MLLRVGIAVAAASFPVAAITCLDTSNASIDCSADPELLDICFSSLSTPKDSATGSFGSFTDKGCVASVAPASYFTEDEGCTFKLCWCKTDDCNTDSWSNTSMTNYVVPELCYEGVIGGNLGDSCAANELYMTDSHESYEGCHARIHEGCRENNEAGMGDGCTDGPPADKAACEAISGEVRDPSESFDGSTRHCYYAPAIADLEAACLGTDDKCEYSEGQCKKSAAEEAREEEWLEKRGMDCEYRLNSGCWQVYMNGDGEIEYKEGEEWDGGPKCQDITDQTTCDARVQTTGCTGMDCGNCTWIPEAADPIEQCSLKNAGTHDVCMFVPAVGPPAPSAIELAFEEQILQLDGFAEFATKCSMIATFRNGSGSAVAAGADPIGLIQKRCESDYIWKMYAEHVDHTSSSIDEYCTNFVPDSSVMTTLAAMKTSAVIAQVKAGHFAELFPTFKDLRFIVTKDSNYGECLFTAESGVWGGAFCTCDKAQCNDSDALKRIVDPEAGPMRLLQFIDGSLAHLKTDINNIVPGLMDENGIFVPATADKVTEANVDSMMLMDDVAARTTKDELWGIIQDYQALNAHIAAGGDPNDPPPSGAGSGVEYISGGGGDSEEKPSGDGNTEEQKPSSDNTALIIGLAAGFVVLAGAIGGGYILYRKTKAGKQVQATNDDGDKAAA